MPLRAMQPKPRVNTGRYGSADEGIGDVDISFEFSFSRDDYVVSEVCRRQTCPCSSGPDWHDWCNNLTLVTSRASHCSNFSGRITVAAGTGETARRGRAVGQVQGGARAARTVSAGSCTKKELTG